MHNKIVLDAGCGTGRVTKMIAGIVKEGKVYAVDTDANRIANAKKNLKDFLNMVYIKSDLSDLDMPEKVDLVFSNAVIHWILDRKTIHKILGITRARWRTFNSVWWKRQPWFHPTSY